MVSSEDTFRLFRKWADEHTPLRFDGLSSLYSFSLLGTVEAAKDEVFTFRVGDAGRIEIHLPPGTGFEYFDPDTLHADFISRLGQGHAGEPVEYGAGIVAVKESREKFLFVEVLP